MILNSASFPISSLDGNQKDHEIENTSSGFSLAFNPASKAYQSNKLKNLM
jgi:hypothetical protein